VFERVVEAFIAAGLVGGQGFAVDASLIVADANKQRSIPGSEWTQTRAAASASRAMREYLASLDDAAFGAASEVTPKFVSPSDPAAQPRPLGRSISLPKERMIGGAAASRAPQPHNRNRRLPQQNRH
jgi:hypothetical protein